jgi:hypothetical protein
MTEAVQSTNNVVTIKELFTTFGSAQPMELRKPQQNHRSLTEAVQIIAANLRRTLEGIEGLPEFDKIRKAHLANMPMLNRYQGNLVGKIGYGDNNQEISEQMPARMFQSLGEARDFFVAMEHHLLEGRFDPLIAEYLTAAKKRALKAAAAAQAKRDATKAMWQANKVREAEEAAKAAKEKEAARAARVHREAAKAAAEAARAVKEVKEALIEQMKANKVQNSSFGTLASGRVGAEAA